MRSRIVVLVSVLAAVSAGLLIGGCSSKSTTPAANPITNPEYNYMLNQVSQTADSLVGLSGMGLNMTVAATTDILVDIAFGPMPPDSVAVVNLWHIFLLKNALDNIC